MKLSYANVVDIFIAIIFSSVKERTFFSEKIIFYVKFIFTEEKKANGLFIQVAP